MSKFYRAKLVSTRKADIPPFWLASSLFRASFYIIYLELPYSLPISFILQIIGNFKFSNEKRGIL